VTTKKKTPENHKILTNRSRGNDFFLTKQGRLDLADGTSFKGVMPDWQTTAYSGEIVFNTGMTGYVESLTDPSYTGQILVFTYPLIGNYGVQTNSAESNKIQVSGVVVSDVALKWSHPQSNQSLLEWLQSQNIPILSGVDTRALTKHLRTNGTMLGAIGSKRTQPVDMKSKRSAVSITEPVTHNSKFTKKIILVDCGTKANILQSLLKFPVQIKQVPYDYDYTDEAYDGVLLSNGPGDPTDYSQTIAIASKAMKRNKSMFGICLGSQIIGLAAGAKTYKLKFGHRGHNQPCMQSSDEHCYITSQNHGYAIDEKSLPSEWKVSFKNLNDDSVEGIEHQSKPFFAVQFHPEACPGPTDTSWLFKKFCDLL